MSGVKQRRSTEERDVVVCQYTSFTKTADKQVTERAGERERVERDKMRQTETESDGYEKRQSRGVKTVIESGKECAE